MLAQLLIFIQYAGKSETTFNLKLNKRISSKNHRKDSKKKDAILVCTHFQNPNHMFQQDPKNVFIVPITKIYNIIEELRFI